MFELCVWMTITLLTSSGDVHFWLTYQNVLEMLFYGCKKEKSNLFGFLNKITKQTPKTNFKGTLYACLALEISSLTKTASSKLLWDICYILRKILQNSKHFQFTSLFQAEWWWNRLGGCVRKSLILKSPLHTRSRGQAFFFYLQN